MVRQQDNLWSHLIGLRAANENKAKHAKSLSINSACKGDETVSNEGSKPSSEKCPKMNITMEDVIAAFHIREKQLLTDMEQMKEKFAKLLLGEDMSGGGKGVSSALALSNAIMNLAASVFGEQSRLEPMKPDRKARWRKEIDWLLSVADHVVELVSSQQKSKDGTNMEESLDNFKDQNEFYYLSKDSPDSGKNKRKDDKWWLPTVKVPPDGLSDKCRKNLQSQKESVTQVLRAAMSINAQVLSEMEVPENYIEALPKNGRASLGDAVYRSITVEFFDPDQFFSSMDLPSEHKILDLKNRLEASIVIWKRKMTQKDGKSAWGSAVSFEKREPFEERAETILLIIKHRFPGLPQSSLDISKIQYNRDVGQALLESYSRILESLAFTVLSRIEDVLHADNMTQNPNTQPCKRSSLKDESQPSSVTTSPSFDTSATSAKTLSDLLTWSLDQNDSDEKAETDEISKDDGNG